MNLSRRAWLRAAMMGAAGLTLDPEQLLWTPKAMIVVPAMPTTLTTRVTLAEWARRMDPHGTTAGLVELLLQSNDLLSDLQWADANRAVIGQALRG
jgi:hypothetical protein